jgi:hypothetical protein
LEEAVHYSLILLSASWVVGQSPYAPAYPGSTSGVAGQPQVIQNAQYGEPIPERPGLFGRIRNLFHRQKEVHSYPGTTSTAVLPPPMVSTPEPPKADMVQSTSLKPKMPQVQKKYQDQVGCAEDYSWVTGQLFYVHTADGAHWVVRYASIGQVDKYGGSMVVVPTVEMKNYRDGDLVCVQGQVLQDKGAPGHLGGAVYRLTSISMINRSDS